MNRPEELIICPKQITESPHKEMRLEKGSFRNDFELESIIDKTRYSAFMRKNESFHENFSIGLIVYPKDELGSLVLLRYNGPHGEHVNDLSDLHPHFGFHIHEARAENIEKGVSSEKYAELTESYGSYEEALTHFLKRINVKNASKYFAKQPSTIWELFPRTGGNNELS
ncbi:MAG: hypothetical protein V1749_05665 [Candidatus Desantisbacteria bacterium]